MADEPDDEDAKVILSRRELLIASALSGATLVGAAASAQGPQPCLSPPRQRARIAFSQGPGRRNTPHDRVPAVIRDQLHHLMIYAAGGGLTSTPWRVVLRFEGTLTAAEGTAPGGASHGLLPITWTTRLDELELRSIATVADRAWREARPPSPRPTADYDEVLAMRDGDDIFFAQGFGPLHGASGELIAHLRRAANAARPTRR